MSTDIAQQLAAAEALYRAGDLDAAAKAWTALAEQAPTLADPWNGLGTLALRQRRGPEALALLRRAVACDSSRAELRFNLALACELEGMKDAAIEALAVAAGLAGNDREVLLACLRRLLELAAPRAVLEALRRLPQLDLELALLRARALADSGDRGGALAALQDIVARAPQQAQAQRALAEAAARLRDYPLAVAAHERFLQLQPPDPVALLRHADLLLFARRTGEATDALQHARTLGASGPDLELLMARCARLAGDLPAARSCAEAVHAQRPHDGDAWTLRFEIAARNELESLLRDASHQLADDDLPPRDRVLIALAAGRAQERLAAWPIAFECFRRGNAIQHGELVRRGEAYDAAQTEAVMTRIRALFPGPPKVTARHAPAQSPLFIVGMPRSGTTLLERILGTFEGIDTGGEIEALEFVATQYRFEVARGLAPTPDAMRAVDWQRLADDYWKRVGGEPRRITDKLPHNFRNLGMIAALFPAAPMLWLRRDPRDTGLSIYARPFPDGHAYACDLEALAHFQGQCERMREYWARVLPGRFLEVDHGQLVAEPERVTRQIAQFCGLEWTPECLRFHEHAAASFTFSELQVRRPVNADGIGRWRHYARELEPYIAALQRHGVPLDPTLTGASASAPP